MAKGSAAQAAARNAARLWAATANPDGPGLLERGREFEPSFRTDFEPIVVDAVIDIARLAESISERLRDHPDPAVRRSAAILAARAHPVLVAFTDG